ncbi:MAG: S9 family peptidase [Planctomycetes bacterium]|nr:S9 family peptidase [Planctomycetota bacterium]
MIASVVLAGLLGGRASEARAADGKPLVYPKTRKCDQVDTYHGVEVPDPYRWLEDADSAETQAWVEAQNRLTFGYLGEIPSREKIKDRLSELWNYERYGLPFKKGGRYFYRKNDGLQNQFVLYTMTALDAPPRVLLDPNKLSKDGTVALSGYAITEDGKYMAYGLSEAGSDWQEWRVREVATGKDLADHLKWIKFTGASWTKDGKGFFYSRYNEPAAGEALSDTNYFQKLYYHRVGSSQSEDVLVYQRPDQKEWGFGGTVTDDGRYLIINVSQGTLRQNMVFYKDLRDEKAKVVELISDFEAQYDFVDNDGPVFWFRTDLDAPRGRLIAIDITKPDRANWREIIPKRLDTLRRVSAVGGKFVASYLEDAHSKVRIYDLDGKEIREVEFPVMGSARGFGGRRDDPETFYRFESFTDPGTIFRYDVATGKSDIFRRPKVDIDPKQFITRQIFYRGKDGVEIPMYITHKTRMLRNSKNPTYLYGYGGFNIPITPRFSVANIVWMEMGGVYAVANIRGGGEYGRKWHEAGSKLKKQTCFDDFIAAAEWLIEYKYTAPSKLAIGGGSNGGLLVGACMTQRPDLFAACVPAVGVLDMLRFHKFTIGWAWTSDYGSAENPEEFKALFAYSPLHNLKAGTAYPATLILTGDHDDRVVPGHSFKFAAALQAAQSGAAPTLIRIQTQAGHGAGKPTRMRIEEAADKWAFLVRTLDMTTEGIVD